MMMLLRKYAHTAPYFLGAVFLFFSLSLTAEPSNQALFEQRTQLPTHRSVKGLSDAELDEFMLGRSFFTIPWVVAPSATTARDGLGPLFNANACVACHSESRHKAQINKPGGVNRTLVFKLSQPARHHLRPAQSVTMVDPVYGGQIAINATGSVLFEAKTDVSWETHLETLADGSQVELRRPIGHLSELNYGALDKDTRISLRVAPVLTGLGLLEKVPDETIIAMAETQAAGQSAVKGKVQWVYNPFTQQTELGRFGYKAAHSSVRMQTADAAHNDMGLTNPFFPMENCTAAQTECLNATPSRNSPQGLLDLPLARLNAIAFYLTKLRSPANVSEGLHQKGEQLFQQIGCNECHTPVLETADHIRFMPYTDLLLHDMGEALSDNRPEFEASASEWRTTALWGLNARINAGIALLHDARARNVSEAILWHSGQGQASKEKFKQLNAADRQALLDFVESL
ncbi:di-heme oxidoredictase family protein [Spirabiliibacterium falconis]|uniref:di-heme oxidoredictase family protein n=1 Tax=Spirabiliibacterium falconis TaxID=572023 RepID=UPI001AACA9EA|nr:di-heme oxidoredictase family protein [Spirabiliibacterium falconis]MBE2894988.1 thiol oxidoreductase [Spirabiliibacterium falconis]